MSSWNPGRENPAVSCTAQAQLEELCPVLGSIPLGGQNPAIRKVKGFKGTSSEREEEIGYFELAKKK